jgi:hypothetical protein
MTTSRSTAAGTTATGPDAGVVESTDPAKAAEVERKASEIVAAQQQRSSDATSSSHMKRSKAHKSRMHKSDRAAGSSDASSK